MAWVAESSVKANDVHPTVECSNKGMYDRKTGVCEGYEGTACQRTVCPDDCSTKPQPYGRRVGMGVAAVFWSSQDHGICYASLRYKDI